MCPKDFADWFPLTSVKDDLNVVAASGHRLQMCGERTVRATTLDNGRARIKFKVMAVTRPILSVHRLTSQGYQVVFNKNPCIVKGNRVLKLFTYRGLYFLPVRIGTMKEYATWDDVERSKVNHIQLGPLVCAVEKQQWTIMELSTRRSSRPCLKFADRGFNILRYDADE